MIAGLKDRDTSAEPLREAACMSSKYALVERERRFVVPELPPGEPWATRSITDLYIDGTRIRLRFSVGTVQGRPEILRKLTQKLPDRTDVVGHCGFITTMYLDEAEFEVLTGLPGYTLTKQRLSFPPMGVDVFSGALEGLIIAEAEFADDETMSAFVPPLWCGPEVTLVDELAGGNLARLASRPRAEVEEALAFVRPSA